MALSAAKLWENAPCAVPLIDSTLSYGRGAATEAGRRPATTSRARRPPGSGRRWLCANRNGRKESKERPYCPGAWRGAPERAGPFQRKVASEKFNWRLAPLAAPAAHAGGRGVQNRGARGSRARRAGPCRGTCGLPARFPFPRRALRRARLFAILARAACEFLDDTRTSCQPASATERDEHRPAQTIPSWGSCENF